MKDFLLDLQVWGTPEQCFEKIMSTRARTGNESFLAAFSFGAMPYDEVEKSMRLFAKEVLPPLKAIPAAA